MISSKTKISPNGYLYIYTYQHISAISLITGLLCKLRANEVCKLISILRRFPQGLATRPGTDGGSTGRCTACCLVAIHTYIYIIHGFNFMLPYTWTKVHSNSSRWIPLFVHHDESWLFCRFLELLPLCLGHVVLQRSNPTPQFRPQPRKCKNKCLEWEHYYWYQTELPTSFPANSWVLVIDVRSTPSNLVSWLLVMRRHQIISCFCTLAIMWFSGFQVNNLSK